MASSTSASIPQTLPADVLVAIFGTLSGPQAETAYAPLVCSHVCARWRRVAIEAPLLWSYIDISRGRGLTQLWLSRSNRVMLDVRLWEYPLDRNLMHKLVPYCLTQLEAPFSNLEATIQDVMNECHRWRSLDIAFSTMRRVVQTLAFLRDSRDILHLDTLTIGPMGSTTLVPSEGEGFEISGSASSRKSLEEKLTLFQNLNVRCKVLRIDTYPISISPVLFSPQLTVLEVLTGAYYDYGINPEVWGQILSSTPNLVYLRLKSFEHKLSRVENCSELVGNWDKPFNPPIKLPLLEKLELSGAFVLLAWLFQKSALPKLDHLIFDATSDHYSTGQFYRIAESSPPIRRLVVSLGDTGGWHIIFDGLSLLQELTIFETRWEDVLRMLFDLPLSGLKDLKSIRLERIWNLNSNHPILSSSHESSLPPIELVDCRSPTKCPCKTDRSGICDCGNAEDEGSNFSESSKFCRIEGDFPSSEESGSNESERSYGEDEGSEMGRHQT
ncbi:hypothetical protein FRC12_013612 [Ceratobasidium sp. 428]|nr:hypothetical protein FRC12_013612 [Ceratobasidium sp. 428]